MLDDYIGDGVYLSWDGYHVVLDLRGQCIAWGNHGSGRACPECTTIALDPNTLKALERYCKRLRDHVGRTETARTQERAKLAEQADCQRMSDSLSGPIRPLSDFEHETDKQYWQGEHDRGAGANETDKEYGQRKEEP